jgi:hypothetical protein
MPVKHDKPLQHHFFCSFSKVGSCHSLLSSQLDFYLPSLYQLLVSVFVAVDVVEIVVGKWSKSQAAKTGVNVESLE